MKLQFMRHKWVGIAFGLIAINLSILIFTFIQKYQSKYWDLIVLFFCTFVVFYVSTLLKNAFIRKHFWVGVTVALLSSWITADFYKLKLEASAYNIPPSRHIKTITADQHTHSDSIIRFTNYKIQERYKGIDTFKLNTGSVKYLAYPIVDNDWGTTDSIIYWACYKYQTVFFGKKHKDYTTQMMSEKGIAFEIKEEVNKRKFSDALRHSVYTNNLKLSENFKVIEFVDYEYEYAFWHKRMVAVIIVANLIWLSLLFVKTPKDVDI